MAKKKNAGNDTDLMMFTQWGIPTALLFIYVLVTLYSFSSDMKTDASYTVRQKISDYNDALIISFNSKMDISRSVATSVAEVVGNKLIDGEDMAVLAKEVVSPTVDNALAESAMLVDISGKGFTSSGESTSVRNPNLLEKCLEDKAVVVSEPYESNGSWFVDIAAPIENVAKIADHAVIYVFGVDAFDDIPTTSKYDGRTCYALISDDGTIVGLAGRNIMALGDNLFESDHIVLAPAVLSRTKGNLSNLNSGYADCTIDGEERVMVYDPTSYSHLSVASFVTQGYLTNEIYSTYGNMESILVRIVVAMIAFFVAIVAIHFANKAVTTKYNQTLQEKAETDLLTGLLNKISTEQKVTDYLTEAGNKGQSAILFLIDIDNFKKVNDTMGHAFGDELLAGLGVGLSTLFRATDIVGRIGGDEFLVLMRNVVPDEETKKREAEKLLTFFRDFKVGEYVQYKCTASIGGAVFSKDGGDFDELYKAADNAMYESKRHGKNRVAYYGEVLEGPVTELGRH